MPRKDLLSLEGQHALVTGGAGGLGKEIATVLADHGASVVILDRPESEPEETASEIASQLPGSSVAALGTNIADAASMRKTFESGRLNTLDILVNAAGVREIAPAESMDPEEWEKVVDVNLNGTFFATRYAIEALKRSGNGSVVNIASVAGLIAMANRPAYSATKHAIVGLTKNLAHDLGPYGIRVNAVAPGTIRTPMTESYYSDEGFIHSLKTMVPLNREGTSADVAHAVLYLVSPLSRFVSGAVLPVDGGWLAQKNYMPGGASSAYAGATDL